MSDRIDRSRVRTAGIGAEVKASSQEESERWSGAWADMAGDPEEAEVGTEMDGIGDLEVSVDLIWLSVERTHGLVLSLMPRQ